MMAVQRGECVCQFLLQLDLRLELALQLVGGVGVLQALGRELAVVGVLRLLHFVANVCVGAGAHTAVCITPF